MGMVLTLARIADNGSLGLAIGIHAAWIWGITTVDTEGAIKPTSTVPEWITGIAAKPLSRCSRNSVIASNSSRTFVNLNKT